MTELALRIQGRAQVQPEALVTACVFVYGTLMPGYGNYSLIERYVSHNHGSGYVANAALFNLGWFPGLHINPRLYDENSRVYGVVLEINAEHAADAFGAMDRLEGYRHANPNTSLYIRQLVPVLFESGGFKPAYTYIYNGVLDEQDRILDGRWV